MLVTFYLSGPYSSTTVSSQFTIVGNPGAETFTGITKAELLTGHSLTFSESVTGGTVTTTEPETCVGTVVNWFVEPQTTATPTPTPTPSVFEYTGCGYGGSVSAACNDSVNSRTFYSDCNSGIFGPGCYVYIDTFPNPLTGYTNVFMNGASWDISPVTGIVTQYSSEQC